MQLHLITLVFHCGCVFDAGDDLIVDENEEDDLDDDDDDDDIDDD